MKSTFITPYDSSKVFNPHKNMAWNVFQQKNSETQKKHLIFNAVYIC